MKKFFTLLILAVIFGIPVLLGILSIYGFLKPLVLALGGRSVWLGMILLPFTLFGITQIIRGLFTILDADIKKLDSLGETAGTVLQILYVIASLIAFCCLYMLLT